ncbi:MAG: hypothetical protein Q7S62_01855 [bacterium]|nr:hypothetical protein [bacterium]
MKPSYILIGIVIAVVVVGGVIMLQSNNNSQLSSFEEEENMTPPMMEEQSQPSPTVVYTDGGYSPKELAIKKGDIVTFRNESSQPMWTASAMHPNHTAYPGTNITNCGKPAMMGMMFDACAVTSAGSSWMFQFNEIGEWGYHNHMQASHTGNIIVE